MPTTTSTTTTEQSCELFNGLDFSGVDIKNMPSPSAMACMNACMNNPQCKYFTHLSKQRWCYLKRSGTGSKGRDGATGGDCSRIGQHAAVTTTTVPEALDGEGMRWMEFPRAPASVQETVSILVNGILYTWGEGEQTTLAFDTKAYSWVRDKNYAVRKYTAGHHAVAAVGPTIILVGGVQRTSNNAAGVRFSKMVQLYDTKKNKWKTGAAYPHGPAASIQIVTINRVVYACGGLTAMGVTRNCAKYLVDVNKWSPFRSMLFSVHHAAAGTDGSKMYVFGGRTNNVNKVADGTRTIQVYDPNTNKWAKLAAKTPFKWAGMGAAPFINGEFWIMGGETKTQYDLATKDKVFTKVRSFDPVTSTWTIRPSMLHGVHGIFPVVDNQKKCIYVVGGGRQAGLFAATDAMQVLFVE